MYATILAIDHLLLLITAIVSFVHYKKFKNCYLHILPWLLFVSFSVEMLGRLLNNFGAHNIWLFNVYLNIEYIFCMYIVYQYINGKQLKKMIIYAGTIYELFFIISFVFLSENYNISQTYPFALAQIFVIIILFILLLQMLSSDRILHIQEYIVFWIALGLLFYYVVPLPLHVSEKILQEQNLPPVKLSYLKQIQSLSNIIMYLFFIYGFSGGTKTYVA